ncbi:IS5 family transposase [Hymenobacter aerilatus]|uniref:IS5 family transposase n=1 Tax=Hymenobacter aerilatus TaxID=2932251 RepID=A0A8T9SW85_9BACT|nr:IS5 family transposase [Hymenobacter aerilatus]UOR04056.1 IS5 family transposase [Hymenobacter aerilatus]
MEHRGAAFPPLGTCGRVGRVVSGRAGTGLCLGAGRLDHGQGAQSGGRTKKSTPANEALGRSRGGFGTKVHAVVDALGNCLHLALTPGEAADRPQLPGLLAALPQQPGAVVAGKAYDTNHVLKTLAQGEIEAVIPPKANRLDQRAYDENLYADRNKVERFFGRLKEARGFATRYEKTATSFLAVAHLLAALDWMR